LNQNIKNESTSKPSLKRAAAFFPAFLNERKIAMKLKVEEWDKVH
jgi:hypothetical protein